MFMGDMGEDALHEEERKYLSNKKKLKSGYGPHRVATPRKTGQLIVGHNIT
jgi:hypothetical protein